MSASSHVQETKKFNPGFVFSDNFSTQNNANQYSQQSEGNFARTNEQMPRYGFSSIELEKIRLAANQISSHLQISRVRRNEQQKINDEQWFVSTVSESTATASRVIRFDWSHRTVLPGEELWDGTELRLQAVFIELQTGDPKRAAEELKVLAEEYAKAQTKLGEYLTDVINGGELTTTGLKITAAAGAIAAAIASGGIASGAAVPMLGIGASAGLGLFGTSVAVGTGAGVYGATQEIAGQTSAKYWAGTQKKINWAAVLKRGATDAITGFVEALAGGFLAKQFAKLFGSYIGNLSKEALEEFGQALGMEGALPRDFFLTGGQRFIADFMSGIGTTPLTVGVTMAINRIGLSGEGPSTDEFLSTVLEEMVQGSVMQVFLGFLLHGRGAPTGKVRRENSPPKVAKGKVSNVKADGQPIESAAIQSPEIRPPQRKVPELAEELLKNGESKAANDNQEVFPAKVKDEVSDFNELMAANDNFVMSDEMKLAAGAERQQLNIPKASIGQGRNSPPAITPKQTGFTSANRLSKSVAPATPSHSSTMEQPSKPQKVTLKNLRKIPKIKDLLDRAKKAAGIELDEKEIVKLLNKDPEWIFEIEDKLNRLIAEKNGQLPTTQVGAEDYNLPGSSGVENEGFDLHSLSPLDRPKGAPPIGQEAKGIKGAAYHALEVVSKVPKKASELFSNEILEGWMKELLKGKDLKKFARRFPKEGGWEVLLPTKNGNRIIDHMYLDGDKVVLRESKNVTDFKLIEEYKRQIDKDLIIVDFFPESRIRIEWRISGQIDELTLRTLEQLKKENLGKFNFVLDGELPSKSPKDN